MFFSCKLLARFVHVLGMFLGRVGKIECVSCYFMQALDRIEVWFLTRFMHNKASILNHFLACIWQERM